MTKTERQQLLVEWNATRADYSKDKYVHELFEAQVVRSLDATALVFEQQTPTYAELNRRANRLAHELQESGIGPDVLEYLRQVRHTCP